VRPTRLTIEVYGEEAVQLLRRLRAAAAMRGETQTRWLLEAVRQRLEREEREESGDGDRQS
jgi:hypothetical protein